MNVTFYKTNDAENVLSKTLTNAYTRTGKLLDDTDILHPRIAFNFNPVSYNYANIPSFNGRYYYITDITNDTNDIWIVTFTVDVLMSWKTAISASPCIAAKSSSDWNLYLNDPNYKCYQDDVYIMRNFPSGFEDQTNKFVMAIFGQKVAV